MVCCKPCWLQKSTPSSGLSTISISNKYSVMEKNGKLIQIQMSLGHTTRVFTRNLLKMVSNGIFRSDIGPLKLKPAHSLSFSQIRTASLTVIKPWCLSISFPSNFPGKPENSCPRDVTEIIYRCGIELNVHSHLAY